MHGPSSWQYNINVSDNDKKNLKAFFFQEYSLFVSLNNTLMSKLRRDPEILTLFENKERLDLFSTLVQYKINKINPLSEQLTKFKNIIEEKTITGKNIIDENVKILFESASSKGEIFSQVRYNMAYSLMRFYCDQASIAIQPAPEDQLHKLPYQFIETPDDNQKRHVQLSRKNIKIEWNAENNQTLLYTPYTRDVITIPNENLTRNRHWNYLIIHQRPGKYPLPTTPWQIDIRGTSEKYLINYLEMTNPKIR